MAVTEPRLNGDGALAALPSAGPEAKEAHG